MRNGNREGPLENIGIFTLDKVGVLSRKLDKSPI